MVDAVIGQCRFNWPLAAWRRATTLDEAILAHGGDAAASRQSYAARSDDEREAIVAFLDNLVIYKHEGKGD